MSISVLKFKFDALPALLYVSAKWTISSPSAGGQGDLWEETGWAADSSGNSWMLQLCLDGTSQTSGQTSAMLSFKIKKEEEAESSSSEKTKVSFVMRRADGCIAKERAVVTSDITFDCKEFVELNHLVEDDFRIRGALEVDLVIEPCHKVVEMMETSQSLLNKNMLALFDDQKMTDVTFSFSNDRWRLYGHRLIIAAMAPMMDSFISDDGTLEIKGTCSIVFRKVLRYLYGGGYPDKNFIIEHGKDVIRVADKYAIIGLKLHAEATLVASQVIGVEIVLEYLLFADSVSCPLLKEYSIQFFLARYKDVCELELESYQDVFHSQRIGMELFEHAVRPNNGASRENEGFRTVSLRKQLRDRGLDIDGTTEMLIARLDEYNNAP